MKKFLLLLLIVVSGILLVSSASTAGNKDLCLENGFITYRKTPYEVLNYFMGAWSKEDYQRMYCVVSKRVRFSLSFDDFVRQYYELQKLKGLPIHYGILDRIQDYGNKSLWLVRIEYSNNFVGSQDSKVWVEKTGKGWVIGESIFTSPMEVENLFQ